MAVTLQLLFVFIYVFTATSLNGALGRDIKKPPHSEAASVPVTVPDPGKSIVINPVQDIYKIGESVWCNTTDIGNDTYTLKWELQSGRGPVTSGNPLVFTEDMYFARNTYHCVVRVINDPHVYRANITFEVDTASSPVRIAPRNAAVIKSQIARFNFDVGTFHRNNDQLVFDVTFASVDNMQKRTISAETKLYQSSLKYSWQYSNRYLNRVGTISIKHASASDSGAYGFHMMQGLAIRYAHLVVFDSRPVCSRNKDAVAEGDVIKFMCKITYSDVYTKIWKPTLALTFGNIYTNRTMNHTDTATTSYILHRVSASDNGRIFICGASIGAPPGELTPRFFYDRRAPTFNVYCTNRLNVDYAARDVSVRYKNADVPENSTINVEMRSQIKCSAIANPAPNFLWYRHAGQGPLYITKDTMYVLPVMQHGLNTYSCIAQNRVGDKMTESRKTFSFRVGNYTDV